LARRYFGELVEARINELTLTYFAVAGALLLLRNVKSLSFGDYKLELQEIQAKADEALEEARTASSAAHYLGGTSPAKPAAAKSRSRAKSPAAAPEDGDARWLRDPGGVEEDPWKGSFGGASESNRRRLTAKVEAVKGDSDWYRVTLCVESTEPASYPLLDKEYVRFFLLDSFAENRPYVPVRNGQATLRFHSYGAFTVGALADHGETALELDLAQIPSVPKRFRDN
jgi:hypothetical protein